MPAKVQSSNLNEELGMVHYIFSDKTGTLTQNIMEFQKFTAGGVSYGKSNPTKIEYGPGITNVNFEDDRIDAVLKDTNSENFAETMKFIECLGICHTLVSEEKTIKGNIVRVYNASSPDELALVNGMTHFGFAFRDRDNDDNIIIDNTITNETLNYKLMHVFEFNSDRKRMSVVVRTPQNEIMIVCKGADSIINARLMPGQKHVEETNKQLELYAEVGLRTLLISYKYIKEDYY